ncbi:hypothetical protein NECAME_02094 [Necator americanus]|uniref:CBM21 domain-containing protein n=1 Tax=Necator americanus TaxID=51031 RepID=W2TJM0_NECAM|nr:hypothetical protein NECAME_02094 [Necator americanus]ETN81804.1 hypothetical protein NECAME_02094 [Necator americanus]
MSRARGGALQGQIVGVVPSCAHLFLAGTVITYRVPIQQTVTPPLTSRFVVHNTAQRSHLISSSMETTSSDLAVALTCVTIAPAKEMGRKKLELKLITENAEAENVCEYDPPSPCYSNPTDSEPPSPDSGFSSDESASPLAHRDTRSRTLPSALRRSRSKVCAKRVRFADSLGLDLEKRQYFTDKEANPFPTPPSSPQPEHRLILTNFVYRTESEYNQRAHDYFVCLATLRAQGRTINGQINVANISFAKEVAIRYTTNDWASYDEVAASYGHNVFGANNIDAFVFSLILPTDMKDGQCQFCVRFAVEGREYWDNNGGANYRVNMVQDKPSPYQRKVEQLEPKMTSTLITSTSSFFTPRRLRRWGRAQEESDDESSRVYIPRRRVL